MENNEKNVQNKIEQEEKSNNTRKLVNVKTVVLMILVLLLVLAVGIGTGLLLSEKIGKENANNNVSSTQMPENKQEQINNNNETSSNDKNEKTENNVQPVEPSNKSTDNTNTDSEANNKNGAYKVLGVDGNFYKLKDIALIQREVNTETENMVSIDYDINKDGTKDNIRFEIKTDTSENVPHKDINIIVNNEFYGEQILYANELNGIYLVDCNTSDKYIDLITTKVEGSGWRQYTIFRFDGEGYREVTSKHCYADELYINQKGIFTTRALNFITSNPIIASEYYDYTSQKNVKMDLTQYANIKINFNNVDFSENLEKEEDIFDTWENGNSLEDALKANNVISYDSVEAYLLEIVETKGGTKYKVRLLDGTVGYFLGPWAG